MTSITIDGHARAVASGFDYSQLDGEEAKAAQAACDRIRRRITAQIETIIETGEDLLQVKELLGHGRFSGWIEAEFGMSQRTATNYMRAAEAFRGKTEIISDLPAATVYALAAAPTETRESIIQEIGSKAPPTGRGGIGNRDGFSSLPPWPTKRQPSPYPARAGLFPAHVEIIHLSGNLKVSRAF